VTFGGKKDFKQIQRLEKKEHIPKNKQLNKASIYLRRKTNLDINSKISPNDVYIDIDMTLTSF